MAGLSFARIAAVASALLLAGCEDGARLPGFGRSPQVDDAPVEGGAAAGSTVETDVEAPEVFSVEEAGLWDGRPSLGGVWVAHPDVKDPERVLIRNSATGQSVVGALFRRERDNPGPRIQASSDAAEALGLLAGQPAPLEVVALRRESVPVAPPPAEVAAPAADVAPAAGEIEATALAPIAPATATASKVALSATEITEATSRAAPAAAAGSPAPAATPGAPSAAASTLAKPYIQVGIFSVESNAEKTAKSLRTAGMNPTVRAQQASGKKFWRVIVGPAATEGDRRATLSRLRDLGFADAYYVTN